jgi:hypothetical protein
VGEKLVAEVGAEVDEETLPRPTVLDVDREARALDAQFTGADTGVAVTADGRGAGRVAGAEEGDPHLFESKGRRCLSVGEAPARYRAHCRHCSTNVVHTGTVVSYSCVASETVASTDRGAVATRPSKGTSVAESRYP